MKQINPYLTFNGNCEEAFLHYQSIFGGEFSHLKRHSESPATAEFEMDDSHLKKILNIALPINDVCTLIGSDANPAYGEVMFGKNVTLSLNVATKEEADKIFAALSIGGVVYMPMTDTFWGTYFGMCEDRFGMNWMINYENPKRS
jgi:PhnB protein